MATTLFELEAKLGLDAGGFDSGVAAAKGSMEGLQSDISGSIYSIDAEIAALDAEIAALDEEIAGMELDLETEDLEREITDLEGQIRGLDFREAFLGGLYEGLIDAAGDIIQNVIEAGFEFVGNSITAAAESGSAAATEYQRAMSRMQIGTENVSAAIGNALLPLLTSAYDVVADILGVTDEDVAMVMLDKLESYKFDNLRQAEESLRGIFGMGETVTLDSEESTGPNFEDVLKGYESQQQYWEEYVSLIQDLRTRGLDPNLIAQYTSGSTADYSKLSWLSSMTDEQLAQMEAAEAATEEARARAAQIFSILGLEQDAEYNAMLDEYNRLQESPEYGSGVHVDAGDTWRGGAGRRFGADSVAPLTEVAAALKATLEAMPDQTAATVAAVINGVRVEIDGEEVGRIISEDILQKAKAAVLSR